MIQQSLQLRERVTRTVLLVGALCSVIPACLIVRHLMQGGLRLDVHHAYSWTLIIFLCIGGLAVVNGTVKHYAQRHGITPRHYTRQRLFQAVIVMLAVELIASILGLAAQLYGMWFATILAVAVIAMLLALKPMNRMSREMRRARGGN